MRSCLALQPQCWTLCREPRPLPGAQVVDVHLAGVPGHGLGEPEDVGPAGAQVGVPEPQVGGEFGVVPGIAADVVPPHMPVEIVGVHHVAVVPEAVPAALLHLAGVEVEEEVQPVLQLGPRRGAAVHRSPVAEHPRRVQVLRGGLQQRRALTQPAASAARLSVAGVEP